MKPRNIFSYFILAVLLASFVGCASTPTSEGTGEYLDSSMITAKVKTELLQAPGLKSAEIHVKTFKDVVQLSGYVDSQANINKAVQIAHGVKGVKAVKNKLELRG